MKNTKLFAAAAIMALALAATGCSSSSTTSSSSFIIADEKEGEASFENADVDSALSSGALVVGEDETLIIWPDLKEGEILVQIQNSAEEDIDNPVEFDNPDLEVTVSGNEPEYCELEPGEYNLKLIVKKTATGTMRMYVEGNAEALGDTEETTEATTEEAGDHTNWTECATAQEAAQGAGLDSLVDLNGTTISLGELGTMGSITYRYMDGVAQIFCPAAAVEMSVIKGVVPAGEGDVSFDNNTYAHEWTQDVDGQEVQCFGNREGEATKTIWTDGKYNYAVVAYGAGGDDDYGLQAEDVAIMVSAAMK